MITRALLGAGLTILMAATAHAQQPADPPAAPSTTSCMMHSMPSMNMQHTDTPSTSMPSMDMPSMNMDMQRDQAAMPTMPTMECDCPGCAAGAGFVALLGRGAGALTLTTEQTNELDAIMTRARQAALAALTAEQRAALEALAAAPAGGCMHAGTAGEADNPH